MIMLIMLINMLMIVIVDFQDPKSLQLLAGLVEAAMKSPLRGRFGNFSVFFLVDLRFLVRKILERLDDQIK